MNAKELEKLLNSLSLPEKIGQLVQWNYQDLAMTEAEVTGPETGTMSEEGMKHFGSVLNFHSPDEVIRLQKQYMETHEHPIPLLFMMDVIHGYRTIFPIPLAQACSFDPELAEECARAASKEASAGGVQLTFTPMVDHARDARWGRVMECCGEDPYLGGIMGAAQVRGFQGDDLTKTEALATCVKHYAGYGAPEGGRDYNHAEISEHALREWYLPAYKACLDAGAKMIMPSFNSLNGIPSVANPWLMKKILRDEWGFDGAVISDYNALTELISHGIAEDRKQAAEMGMTCECDIDMVSSCYARYLESLVKDGTVSEKQIDRAVMRVLKVKNDLGLFENPYHGAMTNQDVLNNMMAQHRPLAKKAAVEAAVLLKNNGILPLSGEMKKIAIIGPFAKCREIIGAWCCNGITEETVSVAEGVKKLLPDTDVVIAEGCNAQIGDRNASGMDEAVRIAAEAEAVILCLGEDMSYSGEGRSRASLKLPGMQNELARRVLNTNPNTAVVLFNGRPLELTELDEIAPAILEMWMPGSEGGNAAAEILFGKSEPCGRLAMSFPKAVGQLPLFYAHSNTGRPKQKPEGTYEPYTSNYLDCGNLPLYPFGYGLTFTTFLYEELAIDRQTIAAGEDLHVTVTVKNTGSRTGTETVQLYLHDKCASVVPAVQKLVAFKKVKLNPGESKKVTLTVSAESMKLWNFNNERALEPGQFEISAGYADHLILTRVFEVAEAAVK